MQDPRVVHPSSREAAPTPFIELLRARAHGWAFVQDNAPALPAITAGGLLEGWVDNNMSAGASVTYAIGVYGPQVNAFTGATSGNVAGWRGRGTTSRNTTPVLNPEFSAMIWPQSVTDVRYFFGLYDFDGLISAGADAITAAHLAFQFSTPRGDTNWQLSRSNGTTQILVDTVVPFPGSADPYRPIVEYGGNGTTARARIYGPDGTTLLYDSGTLTTGLPPITTGLRTMLGCRTTAVASKQLSFMHAEIAMA